MSDNRGFDHSIDRLPILWLLIFVVDSVYVQCDRVQTSGSVLHGRVRSGPHAELHLHHGPRSSRHNVTPQNNATLLTSQIRHALVADKMKTLTRQFRNTIYRNITDVTKLLGNQTLALLTFKHEVRL